MQPRQSLISMAELRIRIANRMRVVSTDSCAKAIAALSDIDENQTNRYLTITSMRSNSIFREEDAIG